MGIPFDAELGICKDCQTKTTVKTSKKGDLYMVNLDGSYHKTYWGDSQIRCVKSKAEFEYVKINGSLDGFVTVSPSSPSGPGTISNEGIQNAKIQQPQNLPEPTFPALETFNPKQVVARAEMEEFLMIAYPVAKRYSNLICPVATDQKEKRICAMGILHDLALIWISQNTKESTK